MPHFKVSGRIIACIIITGKVVSPHRDAPVCKMYPFRSKQSLHDLLPSFSWQQCKGIPSNLPERPTESIERLFLFIGNHNVRHCPIRRLYFHHRLFPKFRFRRGIHLYLLCASQKPVTCPQTNPQSIILFHFTMSVNIYSLFFISKEGGTSSAPLPHSLLHRFPMTNSSLPPLTMSSWLNQGFVQTFPFNLAD